MRAIESTTRFRKDYAREKRGRYGDKLDLRLELVVDLLAADEDLPASFRDHALTGEWHDHRDCHICPT